MVNDKFRIPVSCYLFGHKENETTDSGYPFCKSCSCHSYWDSDNWNYAGLLPRLIGLLKWNWVQFKRKIKNWGKSTENELPF